MDHIIELICGFSNCSCRCTSAQQEDAGMDFLKTSLTCRFSTADTLLPPSSCSLLQHLMQSCLSRIATVGIMQRHNSNHFGLGHAQHGHDVRSSTTKLEQVKCESRQRPHKLQISRSAGLSSSVAITCPLTAQGASKASVLVLQDLQLLPQETCVPSMHTDQELGMRGIRFTCNARLRWAKGKLQWWHCH